MNIEEIKFLPTIDRVTSLTESVHGSGINYDWVIDETKTSFRLYNKYDTMNEVGMYDTVENFCLIFPKNKDMIDFKLKGSGYHWNKYMLREYLGDTFVYAITDLKNSDI